MSRHSGALALPFDERPPGFQAGREAVPEPERVEQPCALDLLAAHRDALDQLLRELREAADAADILLNAFNDRNPYRVEEAALRINHAVSQPVRAWSHELVKVARAAQVLKPERK